MSSKCSLSDCFYGSVTVGERGQIVIPAEARAEFEIKPGDKLLVMKHPGTKGIMITKFEMVQQFITELQEKLVEVQNGDSA